MDKQRILIVEDENLNIDILMKTLGNEYKITIAKTGEQALKRASNNSLDLVLLDIMLPDMDGYEVCRRLKKMPHLKNVPIVFVTVMDSESFEYKGLKIGAIDYISKPIHPDLLRMRVSNHLKMRSAMQELERLNKLALDANPITGLPGNNTIAETITQAIEKKKLLSVIYADLDNFKAFNDKYGFALGDKVLLFTSELLKQSVSNIPDSFIGHIGGDDFIILLSADLVLEVSEKIVKRFDKGIVDFYDDKDRVRGCISAKDREGNECNFPIIGISMGIVNLSFSHYKTYLEVNDACVEVKTAAKKITGSSVCIDKRSR